MRKHVKFLTFLLTAMLLSALTGCGNKEAAAPNPPAPTEAAPETAAVTEPVSETEIVIPTEWDVPWVEVGSIVYRMQIDEYLGVNPENAEIIALKTGEDYYILYCTQTGDWDGGFANATYEPYSMAPARRIVDVKLSPDSQIVHFGETSTWLREVVNPVYCLPFQLIGVDYPDGLRYHDERANAFNLCSLDNSMDPGTFRKMDIAEVDGVPITDESIRLMHMGERVSGLANPTYILTDNETITVGGYIGTTFKEATFSTGLMVEVVSEIPIETQMTKDGYAITVSSDVLSTLETNHLYRYGLDVVFRVVE